MNYPFWDVGLGYGLLMSSIAVVHVFVSHFAIGGGLFLVVHEHLAPRAHLTLGWIYFAAAYLSLVVINGILAFMLTPGRWLETGDFWDGFFNPTYWPMLVLRTGICLLLAGLYALLAASRWSTGEDKLALARVNSVWALAGLAVAMAGWFWYLRALPAELLDTARANMPWAMAWLGRVELLALVLAVAVVLLGLLPGRRLHVAGAAGLMLLGFAWFGSYEFLREAIRKPWIVAGYVYGNGDAVERAALVDHLLARQQGGAK